MCKQISINYAWKKPTIITFQAKLFIKGVQANKQITLMALSLLKIRIFHCQELHQYCHLQFELKQVSRQVAILQGNTSSGKINTQGKDPPVLLFLDQRYYRKCLSFSWLYFGLPSFATLFALSQFLFKRGEIVSWWVWQHTTEILFYLLFTCEPQYIFYT